MREEIKLLSEKIDWLEKLYNQSVQTMYDNYVLFWTIILGVFALIGIALYFVAQGIMKSGIEKGVEKAESNRKTEMQELERKLNLSLALKVDELTKLLNDSLLLKVDKTNLLGDWFDLVLVNGYQSAVGSKAQYAKNGDAIYLRGVVTHASGATPRNTNIAALPSEFHPLQDECRIVATQKEGYAKLEISKDGVLQFTYTDNQMSFNAGVDIGCCFKI